MTDNQTAQLRMLRTASDFLGTKSEITSSLPKYGVYYSVVTGNLAKISEINTQLQASPKGVASSKQDDKARMKEITLEVSAKLVAYAHNTGNQVLLKEVSVSKNSLNIGEDKLTSRCQMIHDNGVKCIDETGEYDITRELLDTLQESIDRFSGKMSSTRLTIDERSNLEKQAGTLLRDALTAIKSIDLLVNIVRTKQPDFYDQYKAARKVIVLGKGSYSANGMVADAKSGNPVNGVSIKVYLQNEQAKLNTGGKEKPVTTRTTGLKGKFSIPSLAPGVYRVIAFKPGYTIGETTMSIANGELTRIELALEKAM